MYFVPSTLQIIISPKLERLKRSICSRRRSLMIKCTRTAVNRRTVAPTIAIAHQAPRRAAAMTSPIRARSEWLDACLGTGTSCGARRVHAFGFESRSLTRVRAVCASFCHSVRSSCGQIQTLNDRKCCYLDSSATTHTRENANANATRRSAIPR